MFSWKRLRRDRSLNSLYKPLLIFLNAVFHHASSSSECPAPRLPVTASGGGGNRAQHLDVSAWFRGETKNGRIWPGCWDPFDSQPDVHLSRGAFWRIYGFELEGGRATEEPELQRILPVLPYSSQELPEGNRQPRTERCWHMLFRILDGQHKVLC